MANRAASQEVCFLCLHETSEPSFEKAKPQPSRFCNCKIYAHRQCWQDYWGNHRSVKCPYCRTEFTENPLNSAAMPPIVVVVQNKPDELPPPPRRQGISYDQQYMSSLAGCCLCYFIILPIILGAIDRS